MRNMILSISIFLIMLSSAGAQSPLSLEQAIEKALENNHNLQLVKYNKLQADTKVNEAFGNALPTINLSGNYNRAIEKRKLFFGTDGPFKIPGGTIETGTDNSFSTTLEVNQTLFDYVVFTGIGSSKRYSLAAKEALNNEELNTIMNVKLSYYGVLLAKESVSLIEASIKSAQKNLNDIKAMFEEGLISEYDVIRTQVQVDNLMPQLLSTESQLKMTLNNYNLVLGNETGINYNVSQDFSDFTSNMLIPNTDEKKELVIDNNNQLKSLDYQMQVQEDFITLYQAEFVPRLSLFGNYTYMGNANDGDNYTNFSSSEVGIKMSVNLFNGFRSNQRIEHAQLDFMKVETQKAMLELALINQTENVVLKMKTAVRKSESTKKTVSQAQRGYDISKTRYDEGIGSLLEINDAELALRQSKLNKIRAEFDFLSAQAELEKISGK